MATYHKAISTSLDDEAGLHRGKAVSASPVSAKRKEPWQKVLDEAIEDPGTTNGRRTDEHAESHADPLETRAPRAGGVDEVIDIDDSGRKRVVEQAPLALGDNEPGQLTKVKLRVDGNGDQERLIASLAPADMMQSGHGFMVDDRRSRPWKTAKRTHCAHCGGPLPKPDVSNYVCEFDPEATELELSLVGSDQSADDRRGWPGKRSAPLRPGCQCSGCILRHLVFNGDERNKGQPRKVCSDECGRLRGNELKRWKAAVQSAQKRGQEPPPEPEDKGLKFVQRNGPRSSVEGSGHRYTASVGLPWGAPRA